VGQTIACVNQKGGVGKTTSVVNVATYLALSGDRVLVIDVDPQGNATSGLGVDRQSLRGTLYDALMGEASLRDVVTSTGIEGLDLVPSSVALAGAEVELAPLEQRERRLRRLVLEVAGEYDFVVLDCPPSLGLLTVNALTAADSVLIPIQCEYYALEGLTQLIATINLVRDNLNPALDIHGVVLTMFDGRTNLSSEVAAEVRRHLGSSVFATVIPRNVRLSEAPSFGKPIAMHAPGSTGALAYENLAAEVRRRAPTARVDPPTDPEPVESAPAQAPPTTETRSAVLSARP
jgi:chromosome partitioning protein